MLRTVRVEGYTRASVPSITLMSLAPTPTAETPLCQKYPRFLSKVKSNCYGLVKLLGNCLLWLLALAAGCWSALLVKSAQGKAEKLVRHKGRRSPSITLMSPALPLPGDFCWCLLAC